MLVPPSVKAPDGKVLFLPRLPIEDEHSYGSCLGACHSETGLMLQLTAEVVRRTLCLFQVHCSQCLSEGQSERPQVAVPGNRPTVHRLRASAARSDSHQPDDYGKTCIFTHILSGGMYIDLHIGAEVC